jgi:hypothetical protein
MWLLLFVAALLAAEPVGHSRPEVTVTRLPEGFVQPSAAVSPDGSVHIVCLSGSPRASDVHWLKRLPNEKEFAAPVRVNSTPGAAVAMGTIRGPQIVVDPAEVLHVLWNGSKAASDALSVKEALIYTRLGPASEQFEAERNLLGSTVELDGGAAIAAAPSGEIAVVWHAAEKHGAGEGNREVFVRRSGDGGKSLGAPAQILGTQHGVCACCSLGAGFNANGTILVLYRGASTPTSRGMMLALEKSARSNEFLVRPVEAWEIGTCPMSSVGLAPHPTGIVGTWETDGQVRFAPADTFADPMAPSGTPGSRKHPRVAVNGRGEFLLVWTEGTGWNQGGTLAWQVFGPDAKPFDEARGSAKGVPAWGLAAVIALPDGNFEIFY